MVNIGQGIFDYTSNVSGTANVNVGEDTGSEYQNAPISALRTLLLGVTTNAGGEFYVYTDGTTYFARNNLTGAIEKTSTHADIVLQYAIDTLFAGSALGTSGHFRNIWTGGKYGRINVGPGIYNIYTAVILKSRISIYGSGRLNTRFKLADNLAPGINNNSLDVFKSKGWDVGSISSTFQSNPSTQPGDFDITVACCTIDGNKANNPIPSTNTATTTFVNSVETAGTDSWGHGLAYFGYGLTCYDIEFKDCNGAGLIIQNSSTDIADEGTFLWNYIHHCDFNLNGRQGLLMRHFQMFVHDINCASNGEAGIDSQYCDYWSGAGILTDYNSYYNGTNHGNISSTIYDPNGYDVRLTTTSQWWVSNGWQEGPLGPGDSMVLGASNAPNSATGFQLKGSVIGLFLSNMQFDNPRYASLYISQKATNVRVSSTRFQGQDAITPPSNPDRTACGIQLNGNGNTIEAQFNTHDTSGCPTCVIVGGLRLASQSSQESNGALNNYVKMNCADTFNILDWEANGSPGAVNRGNTFDVTYSANANSGRVFFKAGGQAVDFTKNRFSSQSALWNSASNGVVQTPSLGQNGGTVIISGDTSTTTFVATSHSLLSTPNILESRAKNSGAANAPSYYVTADATNITFNFLTAPASGQHQYWWNAKVSP